MTDKQARIETVVCHRFVRGYMAYVWRGGFIYQVFSGPERRQVEADAQQYAGLADKGLV